MSASGRAIALALLLVVLPAPPAGAQSTPDIPPPPGGTPEQFDCSQPVEECFPDLIPSNPTADASDERYPVTVCTNFLNVGRGPTAGSFRVRLDIDGVAVSEHQATDVYQTGHGNQEPICQGDIKAAAGTHTFTVTVDANEEVVESNERNNVRTIRFTVGPTPRVDLRLTSLTVNPHDGGPRDNQLFIINITNIGREWSNETTVDLTDDNGFLATFVLRPLGPGRSQMLIHATRPEYRPVGTFIARAVVDPMGNNSEIDELNNVAYAEYTVLDHPAPDFVITNVTLLGTNFTEYRRIRTAVTVENAGDRLVNGNFVRAYNESGGLVAQGYSRDIVYPTLSNTVYFDLILRAGERSIRLVADPLNLAAERNETNNEWILNLTVVEAPIVVNQPDLVVERIFALPNDPRPGEAVSVGALVRNVGTNKSNATSLNFSVDGTPLGTTAIPALTPGNSFSTYVPWLAREGGLYHIAAIADPADLVRETREEDNILTLDFLVKSVAPPDPEPEPPLVVPPTPTTPTPTTPTRPTTPTPTTPPVNRTTADRIAIGEISISTRPVPGGVKGVLSASLRNPNVQPLTSVVEVTFKVDGQALERGTVIINGIRGAASTSATLNDVDLPEGKHTVTAEVRIVGTTDAPLVREETYEAAAGEKAGLPGPGAAALVALAGALALLRRRR